MSSLHIILYIFWLILILSSFWGVFWVDVSTSAVAERSFLDIARKFNVTVETFTEAREVLANVNQSWLLILDNADYQNFDYQTYFPPGNFGVVLMTSRNPRCHRFATIGFEALEGLDEEDARPLLLRAAAIHLDQWPFYEEHARAVTDTLGSHPLALIQAGAYVARSHCTLQQYLQVYQRHRQRLLKFHDKQAQSRYGHVYATFEASAQVLESSGDETAKDALQLLSILSMLGSGGLPMAIFEAAWQGAQRISPDAVMSDDVYCLSKWHVSQLLPFIQAHLDEWDSFRVVEASHLLVSLSLIDKNNQNGFFSISMHPLTHGWARDRQSQEDQDRAWVSTGSMIALSYSDTDLWRAREWQLRPHIHSYLDKKGVEMFSCGPRLMIARILVRCGWLLHQMRDDSRLFAFLQYMFKGLAVNLMAPSQEWLSLYDLKARNLLTIGNVREAVQIFEHIVKIQAQTLAENHPDRLASQHELARAYLVNGQVREAVRLLEYVVKTRAQTLAENHSIRLTSQHVLAGAYLANGQVREAVRLLEHVVKIREQTLGENHPSRLTSQHELAGAYLANGQVREAVQLLEHVVKIREQTLAENHPDRLASQHELARAYFVSNQADKAISLMEYVIEVKQKALREDHPSRMVSQDVLSWFRTEVRNCS
jgi:tetratricopeptide (TPR) repeat protein